MEFYTGSYRPYSMNDESHCNAFNWINGIPPILQWAILQYTSTGGIPLILFQLKEVSKLLRGQLLLVSRERDLARKQVWRIWGGGGGGEPVHYFAVSQPRYH